MSTMLIDTLHAVNRWIKWAGNGALPAPGTAEDGMKPAKESEMRTVTNVLSMILAGASTAAGIVTTLQKLDRDGGLAWLGLSRRRSVVGTVGILAAGAAVGAGIALWFAPMAGADLRSALAGPAKNAAKGAEIRAEGAVESAAAAGKAAGDEATRARASLGSAPRNGNRAGA